MHSESEKLKDPQHSPEMNIYIYIHYIPWNCLRWLAKMIGAILKVQVYRCIFIYSLSISLLIVSQN